ncbi:MAG TPA: exosortase/archaeosortase family protein [Candidatus Limnocylindrales bacterium]|nr:exosortase/archaeosortase family protein [Candidatus Limnocylindrales bacterium]
MEGLSKIKQHSDTIVKLLPLFAFAAPLVLLYLLNPADPYLQVSAQASFQLMWKGRTFQLFFIWLIALEFILSWEAFKLKIDKQNMAKLAAVAVALLLPTLYVVSEYYLGLNGVIATWSLQRGVAFYDSMPLSVEYLVFSVLFCLIALLYFGKKGLVDFTLPGLFVGLVGIIYTIDNVFPNGEFTPFQIMVPTTATLAAKVLNWMGCVTSLTTVNGMPTLQATGPLGTATFSIAWPCAGIESFLIFTAVILLFLQQMELSWKAKTACFVVGAVITYFVNVLRIVTIFSIGMKYGVNSVQVDNFHDYYGPLYSIIWIVTYPLIILVGQGLWRRRKMGKTRSDANVRKPQQAQLNPV